ncbi:ribosomal protein L7/L12 [Paenibacillus tritici]|uniref:Ribosomal protein L7/L12 n=1 Tax=Paenibacillus tritici TaxID=1873425 RepID=A0ABX2DSK8_9BACL|nr:ribosomal protein L7/L12 [Paenibacillus tritici]NQX47668.1 ribosomal protein L7/L12 [Paenibacillus tritici]
MDNMETMDLIAILALVLALLLMLSVFSLKRRVHELESRLAQRDTYGGPSVQASSRTTDIPTPMFVQNPEIAPDLERRIRLLIAEGKKIQAIKVMREARNLSLKDAKDFVESLEQGGTFR